MGKGGKVVLKNEKQVVKLIEERLELGRTRYGGDIPINGEKHRDNLQEYLKEIDKFLKKDQAKEIELAAEDLRMATRHLGSIVGKVDVEEILESIFKDFCIGK